MVPSSLSFSGINFIFNWNINTLKNVFHSHTRHQLSQWWIYVYVKTNKKTWSPKENKNICLVCCSLNIVGNVKGIACIMKVDIILSETTFVCMCVCLCCLLLPFPQTTYNLLWYIDYLFNVISKIPKKIKVAYLEEKRNKATKQWNSSTY